MSRHLLALCALSMAACATTSSAPTPTAVATPAPTTAATPAPPEWLSLNGRIDPDETPDCAKSRFGVGGATGLKNKSLLQSQAMAAARADLARRLSACWAKRIEGLPHQSELSPEESIASNEVILKSFVNGALNSATVVHTWQPDAQSAYFHIDSDLELWRSTTQK